MNPEPKENSQYPGFYEIPGYSKYLLNKQGEMLRKRDGALMPLHKLANGPYMQYHVHHDKDAPRNVRIMPLRHRLMCLVFKPREDVRGLVINHINGKAGDDRLENLEWCTYKENAEHAGRLGISPKCIPLYALDIDTGRVDYYPSHVEAAKAIGIGKDAMLYRLTKAVGKIFPERKIYKRASYPYPSREVLETIAKQCKPSGTSKPVLARNIVTHVCLEFSQITEASTFLEIGMPSMSLFLSKHDQPVVRGFWQIKYKYDHQLWREVGNPYVEYATTMGWRAVKAVNVESGEIREYFNTNRCAKDTNISITLLNYYLKYCHGKPTSSGWEYSYL